MNNFQELVTIDNFLFQILPSTLRREVLWACESLQVVSKSTILPIAISTIFHGTMVKMTCTHILDYIMVLSCKYNYDLHLLLVWRKMKMKNAFI
jgi:hypothetical protein